MKDNGRIVSWFRDDPLPGFIADPAIVLGGTSLFKEFLGVVCEKCCAGELAVAVPFVGGGILATDSFWESMNHRAIEVRMVVRTESNAISAWEQLRRFPWRSVQVGWVPRLHAKMYAFRKVDGGGVALIGSHNLSRSGTLVNEEAGTLIVSRRPGPVGVLVANVYDRIESLLAASTMTVDTLKWPDPAQQYERRES